MPYVDVERLDLGHIDTTPVPEDQLPIAMRNVSRWERELVPQDPDAKKIQAVVGVARYQGDNQLSVDEIVTLVGLRYHQMKTSYDISRN